MFSVGTHQSQNHPFEPNALDDRYEIIELIDRGGMSVVYKAEDSVLKRTVAVKTLALQRLGQAQLVRFQTEARAVSALQHEGIIRVLDFGVSKTGQPYLVLDYLEGETLLKLMQRHGALPLRKALHVVTQICEALIHAHQHGVIHRDIKSNNIMLVDQNCTARVIDFGIAVILEQTKDYASLTPNGIIIGSPSYMSPEQITQSRRLDARTDIYSLGCVLYESLVGKPPFTGASAIEIMQKHTKDAPPPVKRGICPESLRSTVNEVLAKALAKEPEDRYQSIEEFHDDLLYLLDRMDEMELPKCQENLERERQSCAQRLRESDVFKRRELYQARRAGLINIAFLLTLLLATTTIVATITWTRCPTIMCTINDTVSNFGSDRDSTNELGKLVAGTTDHVLESKEPRPLAGSLAAYGFRKSVSLSGFDLSKVDTTPFRAMTKVTSLNVSNCKLRSQSLADVSKMSNLVVLNVATTNDLKADDLKKLSHLKNLKLLDLRKCDITDEEIHAVASLKSLEIVKLGWNRRITGQAIKELATLPNLKSLDFSGSHLDLADFEQLAQAKQLEGLILDYTKAGNDFIPLFKRLEKLTHLSVKCSGFTYAGITSLIDQSNLMELRVDGCKISDLDFIWLTTHHSTLGLFDNTTPYPHLSKNKLGKSSPKN